jgi:hypothetical protein
MKNSKETLLILGLSGRESIRCRTKILEKSEIYLDKPVYTLEGTTLRFDNKGLGRTRLYSDSDIEKLKNTPKIRK